jgi:hypothetical protein
VYYKIVDFLILKGIVQQKLRWVENGINRSNASVMGCWNCFIFKRETIVDFAKKRSAST